MPYGIIYEPLNPSKPPNLALLTIHTEMAHVLVGASIKNPPPTRQIGKIIDEFKVSMLQAPKEPVRASSLSKFNKKSATRVARAPATIYSIIAKSRAEALQMDKDDQSDIKVYTDASGKYGNIGAAAILYYGSSLPEVARYYLGTSTKHSVFEGECLGQLLGLRLLERKVEELGRINLVLCLSATIAVDNQESLRCLGSNAQKQPNRGRNPSSRIIIQEIHKAHSRMIAAHPELCIRFRWVPSHSGVVGENEVDKEAKKSTEGPERDTVRHDQIFEIVSA